MLGAPMESMASGFDVVHGAGVGRAESWPATTMGWQVDLTGCGGRAARAGGEGGRRTRPAARGEVGACGRQAAIAQCGSAEWRREGGRELAVLGRSGAQDLSTLELIVQGRFW